ncbi:acyltransferase family protein [Enterococcus malodoratus]|uniref:acyltransferase family protein n=1 Tax=Enterococcus malodoratus TaxID=71451 RepID=UPI0039AF539E
MKTRDYQIDNIKGLLIILVVFGHMFLASSSENNWLTTLIYSFHMPAFIFLNGLFSKHINVKKVLHFGCLYILVQLAYILVVKTTNYPWIPESDIIVTPIFHVWYLLSLTIWYLLSIIIKKFSLHPAFVLIISVLLALFVRFIDLGVDGNYFAYARTIVFAPFFFAGYFVSLRELLNFRNRIQNFKFFWLILTVLIVGLNVFYFGNDAQNWMRLFFGYVNYSHFADSNVVFIGKEIVQYLLGSVAIIILLSLMSVNRGFLNRIGQHTLAIFICHPVIYFIVYNHARRYSPDTLKPIMTSLVLTVCAIIWSLVVERLLQIVKNSDN